MTARRASRSFLLKAVVIGLGGVMVAPVMILVAGASIYRAQIDRTSLDPVTLVFGAAGVVIVWLAVRALRRDGGETWRLERGLRYALIPCLAIGIAGGAYAVYRLEAGRRFLIERDARYLCDKLARTDQTCVDAAASCRQRIGRDTATDTAHDAEALDCIRRKLGAP